MFKLEEPIKEITINKYLRMPSELVDKINKTIKGKKISFTKFVILACLYALDNIDNKELTKK